MAVSWHEPSLQGEGEQPGLFQPGPCGSGQLTEPALLPEADEGIPLVHDLHQLPQDLVLSLTVLRCLQGF